MKTIEYRAVYSGVVKLGGSGGYRIDLHEEVVRVQARDINSGFVKALRIARQPLGSGAVREISSLQFWQVV